MDPIMVTTIFLYLNCGGNPKEDDNKEKRQGNIHCEHSFCSDQIFTCACSSKINQSHPWTCMLKISRQMSAKNGVH